MVHKILFNLIFISLLFLNTTIVYSAVQKIPERPEDISFLLKPIVAQYHLPGMIAAVISEDKIISIGANGIRKRGATNKITVEDIFHIGSNTKSMTATVIAFLVQKKMLRWNTKVSDIFPELKSKINPVYKDLTLEELLAHRGGVVSNIDYDQIQLAAKNNLVTARQMAMEQALEHAPEAPPGTFHYSNMGYIIAGHMAEKVTGQSWEELIQNLLFSPLNMKSAGFGPPSLSSSFSQPVGHHENGKPVSLNEYGDNPAMLGSAGTVHLSIYDWAKYINFHLRAAEGKPQSLLTLDLFKKLHTPIATSPPAYAMGWIVDKLDWAKGPVLVHSGSNELWYAKVWIVPKRNIAILVVVNQGGKKANEASNAAGLALMLHILHLHGIKTIGSQMNK